MVIPIQADSLTTIDLDDKKKSFYDSEFPSLFASPIFSLAATDMRINH